MNRIYIGTLFIAFLLSCGESDNPIGDDAISTNLNGKLVFQSNRTGNFEIFMTDGTGSGITNISAEVFDDIHPSLSLNGNQLAYVSNRDGTPRIYIYQNKQTTQITLADAEYTVPQISHRGDKIVFVRNFNIFVMTSAGTGLTQLTFNSGDTVNYSPAYSFDDTKIVFTRSIGGGNADLMLMNGLGGSIQNLTNGIGDNQFPAFSPDGTKIIFSRNHHISFLTISNNSVLDLMPDDSLRFNGFPVFSPDGNSIAFVSNRTGNMEIFTMKSNGQSIKNITENASIDTYPYWSK